MLIQLRLPVLYLTAISAITNGYVAPDGEYPYHVSIKYKGEHICSGSIIDRQHILTSGLCIASSSSKNLQVFTGTNSRETGGDPYDVLKIIMPDQPQDDIALVRTIDKINFNNKVHPIRIATDSYKGKGIPIFVTGWKRLLDGKPNTDKLHVYNYKSFNQFECRRKYSYVTEKNICIMKLDRKRICNVDMGGAIVADDQLIGIKSYGDRCVGYKPEVHFRIYHSLRWIIRNSDLHKIIKDYNFE